MDWKTIATQTIVIHTIADKQLPPKTIATQTIVTHTIVTTHKWAQMRLKWPRMTPNDTECAQMSLNELKWAWMSLNKPECVWWQLCGWQLFGWQLCVVTIVCLQLCGWQFFGWQLFFSRLHQAISCRPRATLTRAITSGIFEIRCAQNLRLYETILLFFSLYCSKFDIPKIYPCCSAPLPPTVQCLRLIDWNLKYSLPFLTWSERHHWTWELKRGSVAPLK